MCMCSYCERNGVVGGLNELVKNKSQKHEKLASHYLSDQPTSEGCWGENRSIMNVRCLELFTKIMKAGRK